MDLPHTYSLTLDTALVSAYAGHRGVVVAEIAGRDSVAAVIAAAYDSGRTIHTVVPTAVFTGTEYGDPAAPHHAVDHIARLLPDVEFAPLTWVGDPRMWAALNGRFASVIAGRYGLFSPCLACHLYVHLCRIPLALALGNAPVIAGERETHDGRIKYSQIATSIDICIEILASVGIELLEPLRTASGDEVASYVGDDWAAGPGQLKCVLSGNYRDMNGGVSLGKDAYHTYAEKFLQPVGLALATALTEGDSAPDYLAIVRDVLGGCE